MCSPDTRDVPYVFMWLICFMRASYSDLQNQQREETSFKFNGSFYSATIRKLTDQGSLSLIY